MYVTMYLYREYFIAILGGFMSKRNTYTFYVTGKKENDAVVLQAIDDTSYVLFDLPYTPPYEEFLSIKAFQYESRYRPFKDDNHQRKIAIINLFEWLGHEKEEYLEIFAKFLHDYQSFFEYEYIFTVGDAKKAEIKSLYMLMAQYLEKGKIVEDNTLTDVNVLSAYLKEHFPIEDSVANKCAEIFIKNEIDGLPQVTSFMNELVDSVNVKGKKLITEQLFLSHKQIQDTKFYLFYEQDVEAWMLERKHDVYEKLEAIA